MLIAIVAGGIYSGIFTVTEAASLGAISAFLIALFRKKMTLPMFWQTLADTASNIAMLYMLMIGAYVINYFVVLTHVPEIITVGILESGLSKPLILILLLFVYIILGSIFDTIAAMLITLPFVTLLFKIWGTLWCGGAL